MKYKFKFMNLWFALALVLSLLTARCGDTSSEYTLNLPPPPEAWVTLLGEPHWRLEWLDADGEKRTADIPPGQTYSIKPPTTWANPVTAWPYWPDRKLIPGFFKPAGALFPFDADGENLCLTWKAGPDTVFYWELALVGKDGVKNPANFDWPRFRELFETDILNEAVRKDPWLVDWRSVAERTMNSSFDRRRLVPQAAESVKIPVPSGSWYGASPFCGALYFREDETPVFPVRSLVLSGADIDVWVCSEGILRYSRNTWVFEAFPK